jgi:putative SOS response-associated peptidase YedK
MCGRFVSTTTPQQVADEFHVERVDVEEHRPDFNVAPRSQVYGIRDRLRDGEDDPTRVLSLLRWGLVPSWAKDVSLGDKMINARGETVADKPAYRKAFAKKRCIIPVDGFYEWQKRGGKNKQPMFIRRRDGGTLAFAGLWEAWRNQDVSDDDAPEAWIRSCAIVTTKANELIAPVHNRMPVMLPEEAWDRWLDPRSDPDDLQALLVSAPEELLEYYPVSTRVNGPRLHGPELIEPYEEVA